MPGDILRAHNVDPDGFWRNRHGVGILHDQSEFLILFTGWHARIKVCRPGIGVVAAREALAIIAIDIHGVLDHVMSRNADGMNEEGPLIVIKAELLPNGFAVHRIRAASVRQIFFPGCEDITCFIKQAEPKLGVFCAMGCPIVGAGDRCMQPVGSVYAFVVAQESEVGGEIHRVEIIARIGQHFVGNAHVVEGDDGCIFGETVSDGSKHFLCIKQKNKDCTRLAFGTGGNRLRFMTKEGLAQIFNPLNVIAFNLDLGEIVIGMEVPNCPGGVVDRHRPQTFEPLDDGVPLWRRQWVP